MLLLHFRAPHFGLCIVGYKTIALIVCYPNHRNLGFLPYIDNEVFHDLGCEGQSTKENILVMAHMK